MEGLREARQDTMESWAHEAFKTELENAAALGGVRVLDQMIELLDAHKPEDLAQLGEE